VLYAKDLIMSVSSELRIIYVCVFVLILTPLVLISTGLDLYDEGYYLQGYVREQPIYFQLSGFHFLVKLLPLSDNILVARAYRVVLLIVTGLIFSRTLQRKVFQDLSFSLVAGYVLLGNFLTYVYLSSTISYNILNVIFLELLLSAYLFFRNAVFRFSKEVLIPLISFGVLLGFQAFNKPTTATILALLFVIDQTVYRFRKWRDLLIILSSTAALSVLVLFVLAVLSFGSNLISAIRLMFQPDNPLSDEHLNADFLISQLFVKTIHQSKFYLLFTASYFAVYLVARRYGKINHWITIILFTIITLVVFYKYRSVYFGEPGAEYLFAFLLFVLFAWSMLWWKSDCRNKLNVDFHLIAVLFLLPFAGFWGSNNPPMLGIIHYMVFPLLLIVYLNRWLQLLYVQLLPVLLTAFMLYNFIWAPFNNPPVFEQNRKVQVRGTQMKVSDYVYKRAVAFDSIKPFIERRLPLIPVAVPNGLLYMNHLIVFKTLHFNHPKFTEGYLKLLSLQQLPDQFQLLLYKNHGSEKLNMTWESFKKSLGQEGYKFFILIETEEYILLNVSFNSNRSVPKVIN
jgi:hypothetical protein